ncbi:MAG: hypothetical protein AAF471_03890 [Myxococcota bacterium]
MAHGPQQTLCPVDLISTQALSEYGPLGAWLLGMRQKYPNAQLVISNLPTGGIFLQVTDAQNNTIAQAQIADNQVSGYVQESFDGPLTKTLLGGDNAKDTHAKRVDGVLLTANQWSSVATGNAAKPVRLKFELEPDDFGPPGKATDAFTVEIHSVGQKIGEKLRDDKQRELVQQREKQEQKEQDYLKKKELLQEAEKNLQTVRDEKEELETAKTKVEQKANGLQTNLQQVETERDKLTAEVRKLQRSHELARAWALAQKVLWLCEEQLEQNWTSAFKKATDHAAGAARRQAQNRIRDAIEFWKINPRHNKVSLKLNKAKNRVAAISAHTDNIVARAKYLKAMKMAVEGLEQAFEQSLGTQASPNQCRAAETAREEAELALVSALADEWDQPNKVKRHLNRAKSKAKQAAPSVAP